MPRVVPSQVVSFINSMHMPYTPSDLVRMNTIGSANLSGVLDLVEQIPDELLTMDQDAYVSLINAKALIRDIIDTWRSNRIAGGNTPRLQQYDLHRSNNPLEHIRTALAKCADEAPAPGTSDLNFITDPNLRANLRNDIGAVHRSLANGEWKAATVLAGSAAEALLLWALERRPSTDITSAIGTLRTNGGLMANPDSNLEKWNLYELIQVAENLRVIKPNTAKQARLAKDFRNFIHPGVAQRLGEKCDRATAFSAVAGVEHVVRDLTP
jgi:hypothetical protein